MHLLADCFSEQFIFFSLLLQCLLGIAALLRPRVLHALSGAMLGALGFSVLTFLNKTEDEFPWDMHYIGEVADAIEGTLLDLGQRVHRPAIITEKDGTVHLEEYQEPVLPKPTKNKKKEKPAYER